MNNISPRLQGIDSSRRRWLLASLATTSLASLARPALAQDSFPAKPITLIVPFAPGGTVDAAARAIGQSMSARLGQPVLIENVPGAGANIGAAKAAAATPDGYTALLFTTAHTINQSLYARPGYTNASFDMIGSVGGSPCWIFVGEKSPARTLGELVALMKASPGKLTYASGGSGTTSHLAVELFKQRYGLFATHVPYRVSTQGFTDIVSGVIDFGMNPVTGTDGLVKGGRLRALAVAADRRLAAFPDVPTFKEAGFPDIDVLGWYGMVVPKGVPRPALMALEAALQAAVNDPAVKANLLTMGTLTRESSGAEFARYVQAETARWSELTKVSGAKVD